MERELIALIRKLLAAVLGGNSELSAQIEGLSDEEVIELARADNTEAQAINNRLKAKLNKEKS